MCRVERDGSGTIIYFLDGTRVRDSRPLEDIWDIVTKFWGK